MFNNKDRRRKFRSNSSRPFRRRHNGEGRGSNSPNAIMNGQFRQNSFKGPYNTAKLMEKYNILAKEALSTGDKILAENYFQHADHFSRINSTNTTPTTPTTPNNFSTIDKNSNSEKVKISSQDGETRPENNTLDKIEKNKTK